MKKLFKSLFILLLVVFQLIIWQSCVEHSVFVQIDPGGDYQFNYYSHGDLTDLNDFDFPIPAGEKWLTELTFDKENESHKYFASKSFVAGENPPSSFFRGDSIYSTSLLQHPLSFKVRNWYFQKTYEFKWTFLSREVSSKYPKMKHILEGGESYPGWSVEVLSYLFRDCLLRIDVGFNQSAIITRELDFWLESAVNQLADSTLQENYQNLKFDGIELLKTTLGPSFHHRIDSVFKQLEDESRVTLGLVDDKVEFLLLIPGELAESNADTSYADTLSWSFNVNYFEDSDYEIYAVSHVVNHRRYKYLFGGILIIVLLITWRFIR
jgi:hypothetical protein